VKVTGESDLILFELEVDPRDPRVLYAVGYQQDDFDRRLLRSADGGESWQRRDAGLKAHVVVELALDPAAPDVLYAGTEDGLFRSPDAGQTWKRLPGISDQVQALVVAPTTPTTVWVAGLYGVQRSTDGGQTWTLVGSGLEGTLVYELAVDPQDPGLLYAGTLGNSVYTYEDPQP
jgi:photosystem II stability/assembly factor-like uncharacterized protein